MTASCLKWNGDTAALRPASRGAGAILRSRDVRAPTGKPGCGADGGSRWKRSAPTSTADAPTVARGRAVERAQSASSVGPELRRVGRASPGAGRIITSHLRGSLRSWAPPDSAEPTIRPGIRDVLPEGVRRARNLTWEPFGDPGARRRPLSAFGRANAANTCLCPGRDLYYVKVSVRICKIFPPCGVCATPRRFHSGGSISLTISPLCLKSC